MTYYAVAVRLILAAVSRLAISGITKRTLQRPAGEMLPNKTDSNRGNLVTAVTLG